MPYRLTSHFIIKQIFHVPNNDTLSLNQTDTQILEVQALWESISLLGIYAINLFVNLLWFITSM